MFWIKNKKTCIPKDSYIKLEYEGVYIIWACFSDELDNQLESLSLTRNLAMQYMEIFFSCKKKKEISLEKC